jgi:4-oxalomesaconate tautomerase
MALRRAGECSDDLSDLRGFLVLLQLRLCHLLSAPARSLVEAAHRRSPVRKEKGMSDGTPCTWMRGGTSKGAYFLAADLPADEHERAAFLLSLMGSPDARQIDGIGGADPLTSKVAVVSASQRQGIDVDYLFLQVAVDQPLVSGSQNCGNILAGIGPFAIEKGLVAAEDGETDVAIFMENSGQSVVATVRTPGGQVVYRGDTLIDGVPRPAAPVLLAFQDAAGSMCGALLPTGNEVDEVEGVECTLIDNGMPVVVMRAEALGITGYEDREALESDRELRRRLEEIRLAAGERMNLGDARDKTVPKLTMLAPARHGGAISTRTFIPHRCHASIGVFGALSVATACMLPSTPAAALATLPDGARKYMAIEHPIGATEVVMDVEPDREGLCVTRSSIVRTARKLFDGRVFA